LGTLLLITLIAVIGPHFLPDPRVMPDMATGTLRPPGAGHWLGTDNFSRDVLARLVGGAGVSLAVAGGAVLLSLTLGLIIGTVAGYLGGWTDVLLMRMVDAAMAVPRLFLLLLMVATMQRVPLSALILAIGVTGWFGTSRLVRGEVLRLARLDFLRAAEALGATRGRVIFRHLLPNLSGPLAVATTLAVGDVILLEAGLSFLGLGVQPPTPSWGGMILDSKPYLVSAPWMGLAPGLAIVATVLAVNLVGEALQSSEDSRAA
jgi:peptide/nickel transport system permease protein